MAKQEQIDAIAYYTNKYVLVFLSLSAVFDEMNERCSQTMMIDHFSFFSMINVPSEHFV